MITDIDTHYDHTIPLLVLPRSTVHKNDCSSKRLHIDFLWSMKPRCIKQNKKVGIQIMSHGIILLYNIHYRSEIYFHVGFARRLKVLAEINDSHGEYTPVLLTFVLP